MTRFILTAEAVGIRETLQKPTREAQEEDETA
jgi:hypothetical protein